jgi:hypothetical protein
MGEWVSVGFWDRYNDSDTEQKNYWRVPYAGTPNIIATTCLSAFSGGIDLDANVTGLALASFKRYEYLDENGAVQEVEVTRPTNWLQIDRVVSITFALDVTRAWAELGFTVHFV